MAYNSNMHLSKFNISRRGRKLQVSDDPRVLGALPKDIPERIWAEILIKEENDLIVLDIREEILEEAIKQVYDKYMERQNALFTAHCAAEAWLRIIDLQFYRHDPGEEPSAYPPCFIPKREESWVPDELCRPSPKDTWAKQSLVEAEETLYPDEVPRRWPSNSSLDYPVVEEIPQEYWFPGKIYTGQASEEILTSDMPSRVTYSPGEESEYSSKSEDNLAADSELLQKITNYSPDFSRKESIISALKTTTPVDGSLHGAGDSLVIKHKKKLVEKSKLFSMSSMSYKRSQPGLLPSIDRDSRSKISIISDCRLRNLRLEAQFEISSENVDLACPLDQNNKRK